MKKNEMIKKKEEFTSIIKTSHYLKNQNFVLYHRKSKYPYPHFGIAVSKRLGNAVTRNKCKRRMRVILDKYKNKLSSKFDYIIIMKENASKIPFNELESSFQNLITRKESYEKKK